jgi:hypothetical protein
MSGSNPPGDSVLREFLARLAKRARDRITAEAFRTPGVQDEGKPRAPAAGQTEESESLLLQPISLLWTAAEPGAAPSSPMPLPE